MNRSGGLLVLLVFLATLCAGVFQVSRAADEQPRVRVSQLIHEPPIGLLGKPLGERLVIEGMRAEHIMRANPLAVTTVDGQALPEVVAIELTGIKSIKKGVSYKLEGYETGAFVGPPDWLNSQGSRAQISFEYAPSFVVTRVIEKNE